MEGSTPVDNYRDIGENGGPVGKCRSHLRIMCSSPVIETMHGEAASIIQGWMDNGEHTGKDGRWKTYIFTPLTAGITGQSFGYSWNVIGGLLKCLRSAAVNGSGTNSMPEHMPCWGIFQAPKYILTILEIFLCCMP